MIIQPGDSIIISIESYNQWTSNPQACIDMTTTKQKLLTKHSKQGSETGSYFLTTSNTLALLSKIPTLW